jgi:hypothetical protein
MHRATSPFVVGEYRLNWKSQQYQFHSVAKNAICLLHPPRFATENVCVRAETLGICPSVCLRKGAMKADRTWFGLATGLGRN